MPASKIVLPTASCEIADLAAERTQSVVKLCMFKAPLTAVETLSRTLRYAQNPQQYLLDTLGEADFAARKHMLCLTKEGEVASLDAYGTGPTKQAFEAHIAKFLGKKHGLFFLTGVQAQLAALKTYAENTGRKKVAWHVSSHLESAELGSYEKLYGLERVLLGSKADFLPTVDEIRDVLVEQGDELAAVVLELPNRTLGCQTYAIADLREISKLCGEKGVALHCDGARLWEAEAWYSAVEGVSFKEICDCFNSVYVSFYKGLGGLAGAMLVHDNAVFIEDAKIWQRRAGGNAFTLGMEVLDCERGINESIGTFLKKREKMVRIVDGINAKTETYRTDDGRPVVSFLPEKAVCSQILTVFQGYTEDELIKARDVVRTTKGVRVFERLRPKQTLDQKMADDRMKIKRGTDPYPEGDRKEDDLTHNMEWMIMSITEKIEDKVFVDAYAAFCEELLKGRE